MSDLRASAPQIGMAMGAFFVVVGVILGNYGIVGLGVVVGLVGFFGRGTAWPSKLGDHDQRDRQIVRRERSDRQDVEHLMEAEPLG